MSVNPPQAATVNCPACRAQYTVPVQNVIDVGREPRLKSLLLQGRLNVGVCPQCGTGGMLSIPLIYHDPAKELLFSLVPQALNITENDRQRTIGQMSNAIINGLPAEERKGYLLQPRMFLTFQTMLEAILEADGVTKEMLEQQQAKAELVGEMLQAVDDSLRLAALIGQNEDKIDYEFFAILAANINLAEQSQGETAEKLIRLREMLLERTATGREMAEQQRTIEKTLEGIDENLTREDLLDRITAIEGDHTEQVLNVLVAMARPLVDYQFFQLLTQRIEAAQAQGDQASVDHLTEIRTTVLDLAQQLDAQLRDRMQEKALLLTEIMQSPDPQATIRARMEEIDSAFFSVLEAHLAQSEQQHQHQVADRLREVQNMIAQVMQESAPPEIRFINRLLQANYPDETRQILMDNKAMIDAELLSIFDLLGQDLAQRGDTQTSEQLSKIKAQAEILAV
jgi:hypothetical protein